MRSSPVRRGKGAPCSGRRPVGASPVRRGPAPITALCCGVVAQTVSPRRPSARNLSPRRATVVEQPLVDEDGCVQAHASSSTRTGDSPGRYMNADDQWYDLYGAVAGEERLYENVRFLGVRTFDRITEHSSGFINGFLEIEGADGTRLLIPKFGIQLTCEHGVQPAFRVVRQWGNNW